MTGLDGELILAQASERWLLVPRRGPLHWSDASPLGEMARALMAVDGIAVDVAQRVVDDYVMAQVRRDEKHVVSPRGFPGHWAAEPRAAGVEADPGDRFVRCDTVLARHWGQIRIRYVRLGLSRTVVSVAMERVKGPRVHINHPFAAPWGSGLPPAVLLTDDRGTTLVAQFSLIGGGTADLWAGTFATDGGLAPDTVWLELNGARLELSEPVRNVHVRLEPVGDGDRARRHLWRRVAELCKPGADFRTHDVQPPQSPLQPTIEALVAAGSLTRDDPDVIDALAVTQAVDAHRPWRPLEAGINPSGQYAEPDESPRRDLPAPWGALFARGGQDNGPTGILTVDATTPTFDGYTIRVGTLESTTTRFLLDVQQVDAAGSGSLPGLRQWRPGVTWWAHDNRGNHYLGHPAHGGTQGAGEQQIEFWPALDPQASELHLTPTADTTRAIIDIPLRWARSS